MSKSALRTALYSASKTLDEGRLSFQSLSDYKGILKRSLEQLNKMGIILRSIDQLKQKHVDKLIQAWSEAKLSTGTIKNRLSALRRVTELSGRKEVVKSNYDYNIGPRQYYSEISKAIDTIDINKIDDPYIQASLMLQREFGLRREESIKFKPHQADETNGIRLQASWTKGGIERLIPITNPQQRETLNRIKELVGKNESLIPKDSNYKKQKIRYDNITYKADFHNLHGLRHAYAQKRYEELTNDLSNGYGWKAPILGGPSQAQLNEFEKCVDMRARLYLSEELGHSRASIVRSYIGK